MRTFFCLLREETRRVSPLSFHGALLAAEIERSYCVLGGCQRFTNFKNIFSFKSKTFLLIKNAVQFRSNTLHDNWNRVPCWYGALTDLPHSRLEYFPDSLPPTFSYTCSIRDRRGGTWKEICDSRHFLFSMRTCCVALLRIVRRGEKSPFGIQYSVAFKFVHSGAPKIA